MTAVAQPHTFVKMQFQGIGRSGSLAFLAFFHDGARCRFPIVVESRYTTRGLGRHYHNALLQ